MTTFAAYKIVSEENAVRGRVVDATLDDLPAGDVVIRAAYSSVNYKDALAATGTGKILRRFPLIGGIDVSGTVESSRDGRFAPGDPVLVTGYDLGVAHDGGYAGYVRVPGDWVVPVPRRVVALRGDGARHRRLHRGARRGAARAPGAAARIRVRSR